MEYTKELKSLMEALDVQPFSPCLTSDVKHGVSIHRLHDFVKTQPVDILNGVRKITQKLLSTEDEDERTDLFLEIYDRIYAKLPICTFPEILFLIELICILALQKCRMPDPPVQLLRPLLNSIPDELRTHKFLNDIARKAFSISSDIGDKTYLCMFFALLGPNWNTLTEALCWISLMYIISAEKICTVKPSIVQLHKMISIFEYPKTMRILAMTVHLIAMLISRLALRETGKKAEDASNWLKIWMSNLPNRFNTLFLVISPQILDVITLQGLITDITKSWPVIGETSRFE